MKYYFANSRSSRLFLLLQVQSQVGCRVPILPCLMLLLHLPPPVLSSPLVQVGLLFLHFELKFFRKLFCVFCLLLIVIFYTYISSCIPETSQNSSWWSWVGVPNGWFRAPNEAYAHWSIWRGMYELKWLCRYVCCFPGDQVALEICENLFVAQHYCLILYLMLILRLPVWHTQFCYAGVLLRSSS